MKANFEKVDIRVIGPNGLPLSDASIKVYESPFGNQKKHIQSAWTESDGKASFHKRPGEALIIMIRSYSGAYESLKTLLIEDPKFPFLARMEIAEGLVLD